MKYRTIVADPPWEHVGTGSLRPGWRKAFAVDREEPLVYPTMTRDGIAALPVPALADPDCRLFLWSTNTRLPDAFVVAQEWGFEFRQALVWHKPDANPIGGSVAPNAEFLLVATQGRPPVLGRLPNAVMSYSRGHHSQKPEAFLDYIERVSPGPYLELFARRNRLGWDTWGNEALEHVDLVKETP